MAQEAIQQTERIGIDDQRALSQVFTDESRAYYNRTMAKPIKWIYTGLP
jgi:hypothetical protein